ncbi:MAG TPA: hypothetical protein VLF63_03420 [Patescibacteria group bacterium]|nr:hypothetical protein [Patescibacteria group bacterium]
MKYTFLKKIKPKYFLIIAVLSLLISVFALRANNEHMSKLRSAVFDADKNNTNVALALQNLQSYVTHHMNTNLTSSKGSVYPPIQLKYTYQRLVQTESDQVSSGNSLLYTKAQSYCQSQIPTGFSGRTRVPCIEQYILSHSPTPVAAIPTSLYEFDFSSPTWSPDLAGWSLLTSIFSLIAFVISFLVGLAFKKYR